MPDLAGSKPLSVDPSQTLPEGEGFKSKSGRSKAPPGFTPILPYFPTAKQLPGENEQNMVGCVAGKGISLVPEAKACGCEAGASRFSPVVLLVLQGKGFVRQGSIFDVLIFGYFLSRKSNSPPGGD
ncbi:hypothetical protein HQ865_00315 [Mucilaginibacter mali]|uniref:Uncharacterized protein n=1 Tax=Mucilaginibacter mali TaxID=2740462 RepID=A0A7D4Q601_9SPHI|nr:hypothetical protein [Mucilaginibacter mali]QKJ28265.1 hypothetical protein HQ865_00315 [Mucilaginibacter mali]